VFMCVNLFNLVVLSRILLELHEGKIIFIQFFLEYIS
jgi:hypothetical protein